MANFDVREEVVSVVLAELLEQRGLLSVPETIRRSVTKKGERQLPDIIVAYLLGIRIVIEGRFNSGKASRDSLFRDAKERVEQASRPSAWLRFILRRYGQSSHYRGCERNSNVRPWRSELSRRAVMVNGPKQQSMM